MKKILLIILLLLVLSMSVSAKDYSYKEICINASIQRNSDILVEEKLTVEFIGDFSYGYRYFEMGNIRGIENFEVFDENYNRYKFEESTADGKRQYRWDMTASNENKTFILKYRITGAVKSEGEFDKLYYTAVFRDREKPVEKAVFEIRFPERVDISGMRIRTNIDSNWTQINDDAIRFKAVNVPLYVPLDVEILFPKGIVELPFDWKPYMETVAGILIVILFLYVVISNFLMIRREHNAFGKDPDVKETINLDYVKNLRPAISGTIADESIDVKEIISTIIDLAVRGYIHIQEEYERFLVVQKKKIYLVNMKKDESGLLEYEKLILRDVFADGDKIEVSSLSNKFYRKIPGIKSEIFKEATKQGLFPENPEKVRGKYQWKFAKRPVILAAVLLLSVVASLMLELDGILILSVAMLFLSIIVIVASVLAANYMPKKTILGVMERKKYLELKDFMEKYPLKEGRLFDEYLPYAIAFGIQAVWLKKLEELQKFETYKSSWYSGTFNAAAFNSFSHSLQSSMTSSPSSGHGGGGGFGGGGGAGGGGGGFG